MSHSAQSLGLPAMWDHVSRPIDGRKYPDDHWGKLTAEDRRRINEVASSAIARSRAGNRFFLVSVKSQLDAEVLSMPPYDYCLTVDNAWPKCTHSAEVKCSYHRNRPPSKERRPLPHGAEHHLHLSGPVFEQKMCVPCILTAMSFCQGKLVGHPSWPVITDSCWTDKCRLRLHKCASCSGPYGGYMHPAKGDHDLKGCVLELDCCKAHKSITSMEEYAGLKVDDEHVMVKEVTTPSCIYCRSRRT